MDSTVISATISELVSVIMPAYNAAKYISATIDSVLAQTYPNWELIVVDDGSTDATQSLVQAYSRREARIRYFYQLNARQGAARNKGIAHAQGNILAFLDADDLWLPEKLATQMIQLRDSGADLIFADASIFYESFGQDEEYERLNAGHGRFEGTHGFEQFLRNNQIPILTVLTTKAAVERAGGFSESLPIQNAEDYHLWLRMLLTGSVFVGYEVVLAAYREHVESVSGIDRLNTRQMVEAKADIAQVFPAVKNSITHNLSITIRAGLHKTTTYDNEIFFAIAERYLVLTGHSAWKSLFALYRRWSLRRLALRTLYFILNYL